MTGSSLVLQRVIDNLIGGTTGTFRGRVYDADADSNALAQLTFDTGAASFTIYPSAEALDALAADLCTLAEALRKASVRKAAA